MIRLFRVLIPASVFALLLSEILITACCFVLACYLVLEIDPTVFLLYDGGAGRVAVAVLTVILGLYFHDRYTVIRVRSRLALLQDLLQVVGIGFLVQALLGYASRELMLPRRVMMYGSGGAVAALVVWRVVYSSLVLKIFGSQKILFVGANDVVKEIAQHLEEHPDLGIQGLGYVDDPSPGSASFNPERALGPLSDLKRVVAETKPDRIVVGMSERRARMPVLDLLDLRFAGILIEEAGEAYEAICGRVCTKELRPAQLIFTRELGPRPGNVLLQSAYSTLIALIGAVLALPLAMAAALLVKLTSPGPVLFRQTRVGMDGAPFVLYKFRSMYADAEARSGAVWATRDDPRVTPVGKWLRRLRLDEIPQLWNVLRGEMSIVGPRPERPEFVKVLSEKIPFYRQRHAVKPGITGWAQINHRYADTIEDTITKLEFDLYYIKNISPALDAYIIFHTIKTMLSSRGAQ